jgi:enoyl-CoA hydratase
MNYIESHLKENGILLITLNRPEKLNALSFDILNALENQFLAAQQDKKIKAVLITGAGKAFCAGADIKRLAECDAEQGFQFALYGQKVFRMLETLGKPSIAAINGYAFGGGCELSMAATLRVASPQAQFGQPEVKLGVIPGYGGTQRLSRLVGKGRALDLCLTSRFIDANTALDWGLVNYLVGDNDLIAEAERILLGILSMGPLAVAGVMQVIDVGYDQSFESALHLEAVHFAKTCASHDKQEGVNAFLEKRKANFSGS